MLNGLLEMLGGGGGAAQTAGGMMNEIKPMLMGNEMYGQSMPPTPGVSGAAQPAMLGNQPYGPPMPNYDQARAMGQIQGQGGPMQGMRPDRNARHQVLMQMLQQGMGSQGQGQGQGMVGPANIPSGMGPMQGRGGMTATQGLMQSLQPQPGAFMRKPLGMGRY